MRKGSAFEEAIAMAAAQSSPLEDAQMRTLLSRADFLLADGLDDRTLTPDNR